MTTFTPLEMVSIYNQSADKAKQIQIFSETCDMTVDEVVRVLQENGATVAKRTFGAARKLERAGHVPFSLDPAPELEPVPEPEPVPVSNLDTATAAIFEPEPFRLTLTARETRELLLLANDYFEATLEWRDHAANQIATLMWFILETRRPGHGDG